jgi:hypothetical protein
MHLAVIHGEKGRRQLHPVVHHFLQLRRVTAEGHRGEQDGNVAAHDGARDLAAGVGFDAHAGRLDPAIEAAQAVRHFHPAQGKRLDRGAIGLERAGEHFEDRQQVPVAHPVPSRITTFPVGMRVFSWPIPAG